ncbi:Syntaxin-81 [Platanthera guangdongensis]|uniref:Syntaxin-81 n=1 Tax=Platanthera guangdongensis TaxID=2320717 RepID=A0ABR2MGN8_9ASPA
MTSFAMRKHTERFPFTKVSLSMLESINELEHFNLKRRDDYLDLHHTVEHERDNIDHEVNVFVKACKEHIDILKNRTYDEEKNENAIIWLHVLSDGFYVDEIAHMHCVVLILSERIHLVTAKFDQLRSVRFHNTVNRVMPRRNRSTKSSQMAKSDCSAKTAGLLPFQVGRFQRALGNRSQTGFLRLFPAGTERRWVVKLVLSARPSSS